MHKLLKFAVIISLLSSLFSTLGKLKDETNSVFHHREEEKERKEKSSHKLFYIIPLLIAGAVSFCTVHFIRKEHDKHTHGLRI